MVVVSVFTDNIKIYPNPNKGIFNIITDDLQTGNIELKIFNSSGQQVFIKGLKQLEGIYFWQIDLKEYPAGIYYLQILNVNGVINKQIIIE